MRLIAVAVTTLAIAGNARAATVEEDVGHYVRIFSDDKNRHSDAAGTFAWMRNGLGSACNDKDKPLLEEALANAQDKMIRE